MWRIHELQQQVASALRGLKAPDGRTSAIPNVRTIRYYTTIGLLDPPLQMVGRTAYYGPRHLLQIAAIKQLQASGQPLAQVQQRLLGLPDAELRKIAGISELPEAPREAAPPAPPSRESFWKQPVARPVDTPVHAAQPELVTHVRLAPGVTLMLETRLSDAQLQSVAAAAAPLVDLVTGDDFGSET